ncbi:hypothetical protein M407DRAFT_241992 [Tulasnella calospora MUT 4182]|uniref:Uncharacterized protein n=1 Tax=Tulasnella calospora MUT 4182 TaxID=1051891 RepID=A0A0C3QQR5_9AGAM|nr:hypothetical protein M407DRAFT_241992 [Tulasnella calospora MUT 4182]
MFSFFFFFFSSLLLSLVPASFAFRLPFLAFFLWASPRMLGSPPYKVAIVHASI